MDDPVPALTRTVTFKRTNGEAFEGTILIGWPREHGEHSWRCQWSFEPYDPGPHFSGGEDALQALCHSLQSIVFLARSYEAWGLSVYWINEGDHCNLRWDKYLDSEPPETEV